MHSNYYSGTELSIVNFIFIIVLFAAIAVCAFTEEMTTGEGEAGGGSDDARSKGKVPNYDEVR